MRKLAVYRLKPGMKIARPIYNANQQMLLASGTVLTATFIKKLEKLNIPAVYIDDDLLPGVEINDVVSDNTRYRAINYTKKIFHDFHYTRSLSGLDGMERVVNNILDDLLDNPTIMVNLVDIRSTDEYTFGHSVNTCILALITGLKMGYNESALKQLAMGAIMHDLGKTFVPATILNKPGKLTAEEFDVIKKHSEYGYSVLTKARHFNSISALVALQHHERYDGSGYPYGLSRRQIHDFAAIVGLVDMYDALTADRVYRRAYPCHEAFEMLSAFGDYMFDYSIVKSFLHHVAAYPISSMVKLSTGEIGVVMENRPGFSLRPVVKIMFSAENEKLKHPVKLDLSTTPNVTIVSVVDDDEFDKLMDNKTERQFIY